MGTWRAWRRCVAGMVLAIAVPIATAPVRADAPEKPPTIRDIEQRGVVRCAMMRVPGFAATDTAGRPVGFMVDMCRALAAAVLGDANAIEIRRPARAGEFAAVAAGEVDVSFAQTTWTFARDVIHPVDFGPPIFHDIQSLAAWRGADGISALDRPASDVGRSPGGEGGGEGVVACAATGSTASGTLVRHVALHRLGWTIKELPSWTEVFQAFVARECAVAAVDRAIMLTALAELRSLGERPEIRDLPAARQPIAPMVANRDRDWLAVVRWTMFALILAEEKGVTAANADFRRRTATDGEVRRLLNGVPEASARLGLRPDWGFQVISQLGNYGEIFDRHLGTGSPYHLPRGLNRPGGLGGALQSPPMQ